jgi:hypothetical protein
MLATAFNNLVYATSHIADPFPLATKMRSNAGKSVAVAAAPGAPAAAKVEAVKEEAVEADVDMGNMFGDEEY